MRTYKLFWWEKLTALLPEEGTIADSLLKIVGTAGFLVLTKIDEVWCAIIPPNHRHTDK